MFFRIPEMGNVKVSADETMRPIVVMTSNSEKHLPDAFLRRVVYYHISFPVRERLTEILAARVGELAAADSPFVQRALDSLRRPAPRDQRAEEEARDRGTDCLAPRAQSDGP